MPSASPQAKFLLRGSALLIALLILWWFVLLDPLLVLLRWSAELAAGSGQRIGVSASGDWTFHLAGAGRNIEFDIPRAGVLSFTFSLPAFWALMLAAGDLRRSWRSLAIGTVLMVAVETLMLLGLARLALRDIAARLTPGENDALYNWLSHIGEYVIITVLPYAAPFLIALALHRGLRSQVLPFTAGAARIPVPANAPHRSRR